MTVPPPKNRPFSKQVQFAIENKKENQNERKTLQRSINNQNFKRKKSGVKVKDLCHQYGFCEQTYYKWQKKYGGMTLSDAGRTIVKKLLSPGAKRKAIRHLIKYFWASQRQSCKMVKLNRSSYRYKQKPCNDEKIREMIKEFADKYNRFGSPRIHALLRRNGVIINHKKTERIYKEEH